MISLLARHRLRSELDWPQPTMELGPVITLLCLRLDVSAKMGSINFAIEDCRRQKNRTCHVSTLKSTRKFAVCFTTYLYQVSVTLN